MISALAILSTGGSKNLWVMISPVTSMCVIESVCRSTLGTDYREAPDLFFWSVGVCAGFLAALSRYHWKEAQAGLVVLTSLSGVILSEVLAC